VGLHHDSRQPRSLRVRLLLWYGTLLAVALGSFVVLILFLATDAIGQSVDSAIRAEARIALLDMSRELSPTPPYWPIQLSLPVIDTYRDPGIVVEVVDTQGHARYPSTIDTTRSIPISGDTTQALFTGQTVWYSTRVRW
jgi:two-component system, OmpR family, sensor kinase